MKKTIKKDPEEVPEEEKSAEVPEEIPAEDPEAYHDTSVVYDLESLWSMKFMDPKTGEISMVRKAFKPRGKLEFYHPYQG